MHFPPEGFITRIAMNYKISVFVVSLVIGTIIFHVIALLEHYEKRELNVLPAIFYGLAWVLIVGIFKGLSKFQLIAIGGVVPFFTCLASVFFCWLAVILLYYWYVTIPLGGLNGFLVSRIRIASSVEER
jgi:hypothetical protein